MRVRISFDALRLCLLVAAGVTSGYLWRAAFESSSPETRLAGRPGIVQQAPAPPVVRVRPSRVTPRKHVVRVKRSPASRRNVGRLQPASQQLASRPVVPAPKPTPKPQPVASPPPAPPPTTSPTPPPASQPAGGPVQAAATPPGPTPTPTPPPAQPPPPSPPPEGSGAGDDNDRPGWGKGDKNHDHTGPGDKGH
jgi:hypothetical protein